MNEVSVRFPISTSVRQGSVKGLVLFVLYFAAITDVAFPQNSAYQRELGIELLAEDGNITDTKRLGIQSHTRFRTVLMLTKVYYLQTRINP